MLLEPLLSTISPLWALTNAVARVASRGRAARLPVPVVSIGNIVAGGVGKTELTAIVAARLLRMGKRVTVASRGYGSGWQSTGGVAGDAESAAALKFPDEAQVLLRKVPGVHVAVGSDRYSVLTRHWEELQPDIVLLDDGFQHFALARDLDILVHDFSVRWPVLRDLPGALARGEVRVAMSPVPEQWKRAMSWVGAAYHLDSMVDGLGRREPLPREALAFCGLGNPERFRKALEGAGVRVLGFRRFSDHAAYNESEIRELMRWRKAQGSNLPLLTTLKDFVKLGAYSEKLGGMADFDPRWVEIRLELLENEELLWTALEHVVSGRSG